MGTLHRNLPVPVLAKIRLLPDDSVKNAVEMIQRLEKMGVAAVGVHCRTTNDTYEDEAKWDLLV